MEKLDSRFAKLLRSHDIASLRDHSGVVYGIWPDFRLAYLNPAWFQFALENGGEPRISKDWRLGASILEAMTSPVREFYQAKYRHSLSSRVVWNHEYRTLLSACGEWLVNPGRSNRAGSSKEDKGRRAAPASTSQFAPTLRSHCPLAASRAPSTLP